MKFKLELSNPERLREGLKSRGYLATGPIERLVKWCIDHWIGCSRSNVAVSRSIEFEFVVDISREDFMKLRDGVVLRGLQRASISNERLLKWCVQRYIEYPTENEVVVIQEEEC